MPSAVDTNPIPVLVMAVSAIEMVNYNLISFQRDQSTAIVDHATSRVLTACMSLEFLRFSLSLAVN